MSSGAAFVDDDSRVLLVNPTYKPFWNLPGGAVDIGESPRAACLREIREELGFTPPIGTLLVVAWAPANPGGRLLFVFNGGTLTYEQRQAITLPADELAEHAFVTVEQASTMLSAPQQRLLTQVFNAKRANQTHYVELASWPN